MGYVDELQYGNWGQTEITVTFLKGRFWPLSAIDNKGERMTALRMSGRCLDFNGGFSYKIAYGAFRARATPLRKAN